MTDHDDTPSTEERERARAELADDLFICVSGLEWGLRLERERVERNRLAARVAELETVLGEMAEEHGRELCRIRESLGAADGETAERAATRVAKLRAAAAPVELPEGWVVDECGDMLGPKGAEVYSDKGRTWIYNSDVDSACAAPTDVLRRHLLALSTQEDVRGALPDGWRCDGRFLSYSAEPPWTEYYRPRGSATVSVFDITGEVRISVADDDGVTAKELTELLAYYRKTATPRPTAPRTEGGDHGE